MMFHIMIKKSYIQINMKPNIKSNFLNDKFRNNLNIVTGRHTPLTSLFNEEYNLDDNTINIVQKYLIDGADPNMPCIYDDGNDDLFLCSPLFLCLMNKYDDCVIKIVKLLLENGADPDPYYISSIRYTPIMMMYKFNHTETALPLTKLLIQYGVNLNAIVNNESVYTIFEKEYAGPNKDEIRNILLNPKLVFDEENPNDQKKAKIHNKNKNDEKIII